MSYLLTTFFHAKAFVDNHTRVRFFRSKCRHPMRSQWAFLKALLKKHQDTEFGKKYDFRSIDSIETYQQRVPIHTWEDMVPYMEEVQKGNPSVLFPPDEKILMFAQTSGTTGKSKYIPVTETSYRDYKRYWEHTWSCVAKELPWTPDGKVLYFPGDPEDGYFGRIPFGAITAKAYIQQGFLKKSIYAYPYQVAKIKDYQLRYYTIMRIAVENRITVIPIANPSTILTLFNIARERAEEIIEDIRLGQLRNEDKMPDEFRLPVLQGLKPNPERALELKKIVDDTGDFLPRDYWRKTPILVICFAAGPLKIYLNQLKNFLDRYYLFDFGLLASEGRFSFPVGPVSRQAGCCLTLESNFFEFIPEEEVENPRPAVLTLDQCQVGKRYFILITNASGLYRYNISDVVEITGCYEKAPMITFCHKGRHFSNITGEKLTEYQVTESVRRAGINVGCPLEDFVFCLHWEEKKPSYSLLKPSGNTDNPQLLQNLINEVEKELMQINLEYRSKRESLRLGPLALKAVANESYHAYEKNKQESSANLAQYKHTFLIGDPEFEKKFEITQEWVSTYEP